MIFKIIQSPITNFQKPKIFKAKMQNTKKSESNFFDNAHLHTTPKLVVSVLKNVSEVG